MKKSNGWLMAAIFCGAARLVWADAVGGANPGNPPLSPPGQKQKMIGGPAGDLKPDHRQGNGNFSKTANLQEEEGIGYYFKHSDSGHQLVPGKTGKNGSLNAGSKTLTKLNGPQNEKPTLKTVKSGRKETLVNYQEGDPDHPIHTGGANNRPKLNGPLNGKPTLKTVKTGRKETLVNYQEGDPDHPIQTGGANSQAATTGGGQSSSNAKTATGLGR